MSKPVSKERGLKGDKEGDRRFTEDDVTQENLLWYIDFLEGKVSDAEAMNHFMHGDGEPITKKLREIVEDYPEKRAEVKVLREYANVLQKKLGKQQKPTVTKEEIRNVIMDMEQAIKKSPVDYLISNDLKIAIDFLANWLKSKGIEVED